MTIVFVVPCYNAAGNIPALAGSINSQSDADWRAILVDDQSTDETSEVIRSIACGNPKFTAVVNQEKKYALRNVVEQARSCGPDDIIAVLDGDDQLCNDETVTRLKEAYDAGSEVVWTAHRWDINGMNISREMPSKVDPYQWPWVSSHLKTFKKSLLDQVSDLNFKDADDQWFIRGYDQALYLPILSRTRQRKYIPDVCYQYNINSVSMPNRDWTERRQLSTINFVRARGFVR